MSNARPEAHLSQMSTQWTALFDAHASDADRARAAQEHLVTRYRPAVLSYLRAAVRDPDQAEDLFQEFAVRLVRGDFRTVSPSRGRFRGYLKTVLFHLIIDWRRRQRPGPSVDDLDSVAAAADDFDPAAADAEFLTAWKHDLFDQAWDKLQAVEQGGGKPLFSVLRLRTDQPALRSHELAEQLSTRLGRPLSAGLVRKYLLEARERLTDALVAAVAESLAVEESPRVPVPDALADELQEVGLLDYCRDALSRWASR